MTVSFPRKWEIWKGNFDKIKEFSKTNRPVLVISSDLQNQYDDKVIVIPFTTQDLHYLADFEVAVTPTQLNGLKHPSKLLVNGLFAVDKSLRLEHRLGVLADWSLRQQVIQALALILELDLR